MNRRSTLRFISALLAVLIFSALFTATPFSAINVIDTASQPSKVAPVSVKLTDVKESDWFYKDVNRLIAEGIINGCPDGKFHPARNVSGGEFVKMLVIAADIMSDAAVIKVIFPENWASEYLSVAYHKGVITDDDLAAGFSPDAPVTRGEMGKMMVRALGLEAVTGDNAFSDTDDPYAIAAYNEYLMLGTFNKDGARVYNGAGKAMRSEAAAICARVFDYSQDRYLFFKDAVLENASENYINTESELIDLFYVLNREFMTEFTFKTTVDPNKWVEYYRLANALYIEYFYSSYVDCKYVPGSNTYRLVLTYDTPIDEITLIHTEAAVEARNITESLITEGMTPAEKIKTLHDYLVQSCKYDVDGYNAGTIAREARTAYGALIGGLAVCQGYSAAFNMLCKNAGIRSAVITGTAPGNPEAHAWNMLLVDGAIYYVDVTHDDPVPDMAEGVSYKYFMKTGDEMLAMGYLWDRAVSQMKYFY